MYQKSEAEMERWKIQKITRSLLRLKHSIMADEEINQILPARLEEFDKALQAGEIMELDTNGFSIKTTG